VRLWIAGALILVLVVAAVTYTRLPGKRDLAIFHTTPPTPYFHYTPSGTPRGRILVVHGLDSSRNVMNVLCYALADSGFEVFSIDLPGHGDSQAAFNAVRAQNVVEQVLEQLGPETVALGHSLGGALLLDIASDRHFPGVVLFSPAPTPLDSIQADRILVLEGQFDLGRIRAFVPRIADEVTGTVEFRDLPWTGHSGGLFRPWVLQGVVGWLGGRTGEDHTALRLLLIVLMLAAGIGAGIPVLQSTRSVPLPESPVSPIAISILHYSLASLAAAVVLAFINVVAWLRFFAMDYLVGFFFLTGVILFLRYRPGIRTSARNVLIALGAAIYVIGLAYWAGSEVAHISQSGDRWWRFLAMVPLSLPLFLADETLLRPIRSKWKAAGVAVLTRSLFGAVAVSGALIVNREAAFLLLLAHLIVLFWIALWFMGGLVRRQTDPVAAAVFAAVLQAWMFSALFATT